MLENLKTLLKSAPFAELEPPFLGFGLVLFFPSNPLPYILLQSCCSLDQDANDLFSDL